MPPEPVPLVGCAYSCRGSGSEIWQLVFYIHRAMPMHRKPNHPAGIEYQKPRNSRCKQVYGRQCSHFCRHFQSKMRAQTNGILATLAIKKNRQFIKHAHRICPSNALGCLGGFAKEGNLPRRQRKTPIVCHRLTC